MPTFDTIIPDGEFLLSLTSSNYYFESFHNASNVLKFILRLDFIQL